MRLTSPLPACLTLSGPSSGPTDATGLFASEVTATGACLGDQTLAIEASAEVPYPALSPPAQLAVFVCSTRPCED